MEEPGESECGEFHRTHNPAKQGLITQRHTLGQICPSYTCNALDSTATSNASR